MFIIIGLILYIVWLHKKGKTIYMCHCFMYTVTIMRLKEAGNSFQHFSNRYTLRDEYCHCLTSDATIIVSYKFPIIGEQVAIIYFT